MTKTDLILKRNQVPTLGRPTHSESDSNFDRLMYWSGLWVAGTYTKYEVVEHKGRIWSCSAASTTTEPGTLAGEADWDQLGNERVEVWQATPITGMALEVIQWTFLPLFTGQVPELLTEAAGVFTFLTNAASVRFQISVFPSYAIAANNSEASYTILPNYTGAGVRTFLGVRDSFQSTRIGSFVTSSFSSGGINAASGDTLQFDADSTGTNGSDVDLDDMFLQVVGPTPS